MMDRHGNKEARAEMAMIKVVAPNMACRVIDWAIQAFGGAGVTLSNAAGGFPPLRSRTRLHAFVHGTSCPSRVRRTSPKVS
jgi:alkylation response protein AidB-like acyl-CoA dehydrogenase